MVVSLKPLNNRIDEEIDFDFIIKVINEFGYSDRVDAIGASSFDHVLVIEIEWWSLGSALAIKCQGMICISHPKIGNFWAISKRAP